MDENQPPPSEDWEEFIAWGDRWSAAKSEWLAEVPGSVRDAWAEYEEVPGDSIHIDDQERADAAFREVADWVEGTCRLSGFER